MNGQFSTRVITLMPVAIAINIVLGVTVQQVLKLPIYLDSIGTILVGVLAGPIAGALTGILSNLIWQYAPGIGGGTIGPFAVTAHSRMGQPTHEWARERMGQTIQGEANGPVPGCTLCCRKYSFFFCLKSLLLYLAS